MDGITVSKMRDFMICQYESISRKEIDLPKKWFFNICAVIFFTIYKHLKSELLDEIKKCQE